MEALKYKGVLLSLTGHVRSRSGGWLAGVVAVFWLDNLSSTQQPQQGEEEEGGQ